MALTKVQPPVTAISEMESGTTNLLIVSPGGDFDLNVGGVDVADISSTQFTLDDLVTLIAKKLTTEVVTLATTAGADGVIKTDATKMQAGTTDLSPLEILMNSVARMTFQTDGKIGLTTVGTAAGELVDKNYVDVGDAGSATITNTLTTIGASSLVGTGGTLLFKWGIIAGAGNPTNVVFASAFPNALFNVQITPEDAGTSTSDGWASTTSRSVTGFSIIPASRGGAYSGNWNWFAIGN